MLIEPIHTEEGMEHEAQLIREMTDVEFSLLAVKVDWFRDLSPWGAPAVYKNIPFGNGAPETLQEILKITGDPGKQYFIGGYSMGGLFALWAALQTDVFAGAAAVSPSVWFPGFTEYAAARLFLAQEIYLSLGEREEKARNPVTATVGNSIRELYSVIRAQGIPCCLEWNEGNHFTDPDRRTAKGFAWLLKNAAGR